MVVIENIYRLRAKGANVRQAAVAGAGQVLGAITSSTPVSYTHLDVYKRQGERRGFRR